MPDGRIRGGARPRAFRTLGDTLPYSGSLNRRILELASARDRNAVPIPNACDATWSYSAGRVWVRKRICFQTIMAEAVAALLAPVVGATLPDAAIYRDDPANEWDWMSAVVRDARHWDPKYRDAVVNLDEVAAMMVLDAVLLNEDRHAGNILAVPEPDGISMKLWAIDFGNALVGRLSDFESRGISPPSDFGVRRHATGLPIGALKARVQSPIDELRRIPRTEVVATSIEACRIARELDDSTSVRLADALEHRCRSASEIVGYYLDRLEASR